MRIGFDVSPLFRSHSPGVERATRELAEALERRGRLELVRLAPPPGMGLLRWRQLELARAPARLGLAGLHSPVSALPWFARVPRIQTVHELPWRHGERENADGRHRFWARRGPLRAAAVIVPTEHVARDLRAECPAAAERVHVIGWAASASFGPQPDRPSSAPRPFVLCAGGARPKKGAAAGVQALEQLAREQRLELDLVLTGASAAELARPASARVRLLGTLTDAQLAELYHEARAVLVLARSEGFRPAGDRSAGLRHARDRAPRQRAGRGRGRSRPGGRSRGRSRARARDPARARGAREPARTGPAPRGAVQLGRERREARAPVAGARAMSAPRVLVSGVVLGQPMGGVRRHNAELLPRLARLLAERGGQLAVLQGQTRIAFELPREVELLHSDVPAAPPLVRAVVERNALRSAVSRARAAGRPFDLLHTAHFPVPRGLETPFTLTIHDLRSLQLDSTPLPRRLTGRAIVGAAARRAQTVIAVSESTRSAIVSELSVPAERVIVVPNAADHFEPHARQAGPGAPLLCLGHLEPRKNLELVLRALAQDPTLPDLVLAGAAHKDHGQVLEALARELGLAQRVQLVGPFAESDLARLYATCAAVVLPSRLEGFGIVALEAQRAGAPLAIARIPALLEVAGAETPSFAPDDPAECARAIRAALHSPPAQLAAARERCARWTWDASARAWLSAWMPAGAT
jgi:glycosyltransferase involved in cell wall biosynthesis